jgi:hypothetical protein
MPSRQHRHDEHGPADRDQVLDHRGGPIAAERGGEARAKCASAQCPDDRADDTGDDARTVPIQFGTRILMGGLTGGAIGASDGALVTGRRSLPASGADVS